MAAAIAMRRIPTPSIENPWLAGALIAPRGNG
jgi:hypothetical protein